MSKSTKSNDQRKRREDVPPSVPDLNALRRPKQPKKDTAKKPANPYVFVDVADANKHKKRRTDAGSSQPDDLDGSTPFLTTTSPPDFSSGFSFPATKPSTPTTAGLSYPPVVQPSSGFSFPATQPSTPTTAGLSYPPAFPSPAVKQPFSSSGAVQPQALSSDAAKKPSTGPVAPTQTTVNLRTLDKVLSIERKNREYLQQLLTGQEVLKTQLDAQQTQLDKITQLLSAVASDTTSMPTIVVTGKGKGKQKEEAFYTSIIKKIAHELFHEHQSYTDEELKTLTKTKMEADDAVNEQLNKLSDDEVSFDDLWDEKLYPALLFANRAKKGYYIRRVKDSLWTTFGRSRITPFADNYSKDEIKAWKQRANVQQVHDDLYNKIDPNDADSDTYLAAIVRAVFTEKECSDANAIWTQAVLESIFDVEHLSTKVDSEIIQKWTAHLTKSGSSSQSGASKSSTSPAEDGEIQRDSLDDVDE